ncbi:MAG: PLP-dependent aminotransferase family protein [Candidatus Izemoplasma sp.]
MNNTIIRKIPLYRQLYIDIKKHILNQTFASGTKLESVRVLAKQMNISTTTVEKAYNQLVVEGYIESIPRSGYIVLKVDDLSKENQNQIDPIKIETFSNTSITDNLFDFKSYKSIINRVINYQSQKLLSDLDPRGEIELREEIRKHVLYERDIACDANQIIVGAGIQNLLHILLSVNPKKSVSYLNPPFKKATNIFKDYNYLLNGFESIDLLLNTKSDYIYISPSNTYPRGDIIKIQERILLINHAETNDTYIIEDDYNFFIRFNSYRVPSIYSLNNSNRVIYLGSFAKSLSPSHRISYMILPKSIYDIYKDKFEDYSQGVSKLEQLSLALFMKEGLYKRHTKKLYNAYKFKNELILNAFNNQLGECDVTYSGIESNLHIILTFGRTDSLNKFINNCAIQKLKIIILKNNTVILPYSGMLNEDIDNIVRSTLYNI